MRRIGIIAVLLLCLTAGALNSSTGRDLLLNVKSKPLAYSDPQVDQKLVRSLTRKSDIRVTVVDENDPATLAFPLDYHNNDSLFEWGREMGGRFLLLVEVTDQRLERRKGFHLPLVFHKYETVGVIEGEMRFLDLGRGKVLAAETFKVEEKGARIFQATMDDDINDPDLHLTAPQKSVFFGKLEDKLCRKLADRVLALAGRR